ncbi:LysR family transcriptional regulator [Azohydromonas lata]|uniref:LysR family transcriptional regulator n=1 Tax=Azohydromonas lata TaxID=45677 RepID=A0ABU5IKX2_9BURK|nr:LysR family transcriptional regulator [Azohydromonas lata]MDZ5459545.1 LysR family transcriptional regulator [Azohydromonas lata]
MTRPDLNLLVVLDVLLAQGSVAGAARQLHLSPSAMSRTLARLREATGDPLLVRAGRGLVPSPRALALREQVRRIVQDAEAALRPAAAPDLARLVRTFTLRSSDGFVETFGPPLLARLGAEAPGVRLRFVPKLDKDSAPLREGAVDLETGVVNRAMGPEVRVQALLRDRFVGAVREGHPLAQGEITPARYAASRHVLLSRRGQARGPVDEALEPLGLRRDWSATVGGFSAALGLARHTDLVATVPARHTAALRVGLFTFELPVQVPEITVSLLWHPRMDGDAAHRWLRERVREACAEAA